MLRLSSQATGDVSPAPSSATPVPEGPSSSIGSRRHTFSGIGKLSLLLVAAALAALASPSAAEACTASSCNDGNPCTVDICAGSYGCRHYVKFDGFDCSDGNACTGVECAPRPDGLIARFELRNAELHSPEGRYGGGHGFVFPGFFGQGAAVFTFQPGQAHFDRFADGTARLYGKAKVTRGGPVGQIWNVNLRYRFRGTGAAGHGSDGIKKELRPGFQPPSLTNTWDFYDLISGKLTHGSDYANLVERPGPGRLPFQVGFGANGKNLNFGASSWYNYTSRVGGVTRGANGDINVDLLPVDLCPSDDVCSGGTCSAGAPQSCDDDNPCTDDSCGAAGCVHEAKDGGTCDDGDACTGSPCPDEDAGVLERYAAKDIGGSAGAFYLPGFFDGLRWHKVRMSLQPGATLTIYENGSAVYRGKARVSSLGGGPGPMGKLFEFSMQLEYRGMGPDGQGWGGPHRLMPSVQPRSVTDTWRYFDMVSGHLNAVDGSSAASLVQAPPNSRHPFQIGVKASGIGRDGGDWSFDFYMEQKHVGLARGGHAIPRLGRLQ